MLIILETAYLDSLIFANEILRGKLIAHTAYFEYSRLCCVLQRAVNRPTKRDANLVRKENALDQSKG